MLICLIIFSANFFLIHATEPNEKDFTSFELENRLNVVIVNKKNLPLVNIVLAVNVGSKDESEKNNGVLHLLEHLIIFRRDFSKVIRAHGGYFNGHTDRDLATFEISLPADELEFGLSVLKKMIFNFNVATAALDKEKKVIEREIKHIEDDPVRLGRSLALRHLFSGHPYSLQVFGRLPTILNVGPDEIRDFYKKYFFPGNCALAIVGSVNLTDAEVMVKTLMATNETADFKEKNIPTPPELKKNIEIDYFMDVKKTHLIFAFPAPCYNDPSQLPMRTLSQILSEGVNPLLGGVLRGRRRIVDEVSMQYMSLMYGGAVLVRLVLDQKNFKPARSRLLKFFKEISQFRYSPDDYPPAERMLAFDFVTTAKNQMEVSSEEYLERGLNHAAAFTRYLLLNRQATKNSHRENRLDKLNSKQLRKSAAQFLSGQKYVLVKIFPKQES